MSLATLTIDARVARLTINRPEQRNALSLDLLNALHARVDELRARDVSLCVITGEGKAFCAGMDLKAVLGNPAGSLELLTMLAELTYKIRTLECITLGVVNGAAIGGGCGIVTVCDLAITFAHNKMGFPEVDLGVCPAVVAPWLVRKIGPGRARSVLLAGGLMDGTQARDIGIVSSLVEHHADLHEASERMIAHLSASAPNAIRATKGLLNTLDGSLDRDLLLRAAKLSADVLNTPTTQAMLRAKLGA